MTNSSQLEKLLKQTQEQFDPRKGVLHQSKEFYRLWEETTEAYQQQKLFEGTATEKVDPFEHPNNQADGVYQ